MSLGWVRAAALAAALAACGAAKADPAPEAAAAPAAAAHIPAGSLVDIEITDDVTSNHSAPGSSFGIRLAAPIYYEGRIVVPAGLIGQGEVVDAHRSGMAGRPGELVLAARYLDDNGVRIPLRAFKFGQTGKDNGGMAMAVGIAAGVVTVVPVELFIPGGEIKAPAGTRGIAKIAADVDIASLPPVASQPQAPPEPPPSSPPPQ